MNPVPWTFIKSWQPLPANIDGEWASAYLYKQML
jgi:hypothetical protein